MKVLELFCGTKSVGKVCEKLGWEVISVDCNDKCNPTFCCDIKDFDYKQFCSEDFDMVWASPPCCYFSKCRNSWIGKYVKKHNAILTREQLELDLINEGLPPLNKALEIIEYLKPRYWFIENPQTGRMKDYIGKDKNFIDVDYCRFGFEYKKRTRIWNNRDDLQSHLCFGKNVCSSMTGTKHNKQIGCQDETRLAERYKIPETLINYLIHNLE
jgi:hypothetical protein